LSYRPHKESMNKAKFFQHFVPVLNLIPQHITRIPYQVALKHFQHKFQAQEIKIWARNSFTSSRLTLGLSDLDLTFYTSRANFIAHKKFIFTTIQSLRKKYPFLGEINFYFEDDLFAYQQSANWWELSRDQTLKDLLSPLESSHIHKISFLGNMLRSDLHQLKINVGIRKKKWTPYIGSFSDTESFIKAFATALSPHPFDSTEYLYFWNQLFAGDSDLNAKLELIHFPNRYHVLTSEVLYDLDNDEKNLLAAHINWEIWGLMSQRPLDGNPRGTVEHLQRVAALSQRYQLHEQYLQCQKLSDDIAQLHLL
jgi:hypothetical protein